MSRFLGTWKGLALASVVIGATAAVVFAERRTPETVGVTSSQPEAVAPGNPEETAKEDARTLPDASSASSATSGVATAAAAGVIDSGPPTLQSDPQNVDDCTSSHPNPTPGDPVAGLWGDSSRPDTGWTFSYIWAGDGTGERLMQVVWHTFYPRMGGTWTWLISDPSPVRKVDGKWYWQGTLKQTKLGDANGVPVGTASVVFPVDSATRAFVSWRWESGHGGSDGQVFSAKQCVYAYQQDGPAPATVGPSPSDAPPSETQPASVAPWGPYYKGIWIDPSVPGYEVETDEFISTALDKCPDPNANPLPPNCVPSPPFTETPNDSAHATGYTQFHTLSIYDRVGKPAWLTAQMGPDPKWPVPEWNTGTYPTVVELNERTANYIITTPCSGEGCTSRQTYMLVNGHMFGREYHSTTTGVIGFKVSTPTIQWPPATGWPLPRPTASTAGCTMDNGIATGTYCRPVTKRSDTHNIQVSPQVCDVVTADGTCPITVKWNSSLMTRVLRIDPATGQVRPHGNDEGIVAKTPWGVVEDRLGADEIVHYRLMLGDRKLMEASAQGAASRISAPATCVIPLGETECTIKVEWSTPGSDASSTINVYRSVSRNGAPAVEDALPFAENVKTGDKTVNVTYGDRVYFTVYRVKGQSRTWLASNSSNPTVPRRAVISTNRASCSVPMGQGDCPIAVNWDAAEAFGIKIYRVLVGHDETCPTNDPCVFVGSGAVGPATDNLPLGQNVFYIVRQVGRAQPLAKSDAVGAFASEITIDGGVSSCTIVEGPNDNCSITLRWRTLPDALIYRVDEAAGGSSTSIGCTPSGCGATGTKVETLAVGARVHYELKIGGVLHAKTGTVTAVTDSEGGDESDSPDVRPDNPAAFVEPALDAESDKVGAIAGEFRVDEGGSATYRIPLALPQGAGGLTPSLAVAYSSAGGDGPLGTGFSLEGVSAIVACRPSVEAGDSGEPTAIPSEFCLDGQRLLLVKNTHRQVGAEYRTELESFQRIKLVAVENTGLTNHDATAYVFTVEGKDGSVRTFGGAKGTVSSRIAVGGTTTSYSDLEPTPVGDTRYTAQAWLQTELKDAAGNVVSYGYSAQVGEGERRLDKVTYSGGSAVFSYIDSTRSDLAYSAFGSRRQSKLVSGIEIKAANGNTLRYYEPTYSVTPGSSYGPTWARNRPVLTSLKECSRQNGVCYPATTLGWSFASAYTEEFSGLLPAKPGGYYQLGDFNGDGRTDIWWTSSPNGQANQQLHIASFTSDTANGQPTVRSIDTGMLFPNGFVNGGVWEVLDFDGDGRDDLLYANNTTTGSDSTLPNQMGWYLRRSTGTGLDSNAPLVASVPIDWNLCQQYGLTLTSELQASGVLQSSGQTNATAKFLGSSLRADVDGDGIGDLIFRSCDGRFWVALMKRTGQVDKPYEFQVAEVTFLSESGGVLGNNRCGYTTASLWRKEENFTQAIDFDGDGRADLRFLIDARNCPGLPGDPSFRLDIFLAKGIAQDGRFVFQAKNPLGPTPVITADGIAEAGQKLRTLDVNGDGLADLVYRAPDGKWRYRLGGPYSAATDAQVADTLVSGGVQADHRTMQLLDFDGDGKLDLWEERNGTYSMIWLWRGDNWSSTAIVNSDFPRESSNWLYAVGDFDGDGALDSFTAKVEDPAGGHSDDKVWKLRRSKGHHQPRGLLTKITNGFGATTDIDYAPLTFSSVYRRDYNAPFANSGRGSAVFDVATPNYVVRRVGSSAPTMSDANAKSKVSYRYAGLKVQAGGRGSLGFRRVSSYDVQSFTKVDSNYLQRFPYTGLAEFTETRNYSQSQDGDVCMNGVTPTPDSPLCMKYVPPCPGGLAAVCEGSGLISGSSVVIKSSIDQWQFRKGGVGGSTGALAARCVPQSIGSASASAEVPQSFDVEPLAPPKCSAGSRPAEPDELDKLTLSSTAAAPIFLARVSSLGTSYDLLSGALLSSESANFSMADYDDYGNPKAGSTEKSGGNTTLSTVSKFAYGNDELNWKLGRLSTASVVTTRTAEGVTRTNVRRSSFKYDDKGLLAMEKVEGVSGTSIDGPIDTTAPAVATYYWNDGYGNRVKTWVCSTNISESDCRNQTAAGGTGYSFHPALATDVMRYVATSYAASGGRFADSRTERFSKGLGVLQAAEFTSYVTARTDGGDPTEQVDVNGIATKLRYGSLGRKRFAWTPDGASTRWDARFCTGVAVPPGTPTVACPAGMVYQATTTKAGAPTSITFYDVLGRPAVTLTQGFAPGSWSSTLVQYDALGNVKRQFDPFFAKDAGANAATRLQPGTTPWTETEYDALKRPRRIYYTATGAETTIVYDGLRTVTTLPENESHFRQTLTEIRNGLGEVVKTIDANGSEVTTQYDAGGNPVEIRRGGSAPTTMTYDTLGRRIGMNDPDAGSGWVYKVNGAGETISQKSPRGTCTTNEYDGRGRVWRRRDFSDAACTARTSEATWTYDLAIKGVGQLMQETNGQVLRNYAYDDKARLVQLDTGIDGKSYSEEWRFDALGRPAQHFFRTPGLPKTGEQSAYTATGYLERTESAYAGPTQRSVYRQIQVVNARGQVEKEQNAPGAEYTLQRTYDEAGRLRVLQAQSQTGGLMQSISYDYDPIGNLTARASSDRLALPYESFHYDALQRLVSSSVTVANATFYDRSQSYYADGNLNYKNDAGQYKYGTRVVRPNGSAVCTAPGEVQQAGPHAVSDVGATWRCYDANGNMLRQLNNQTGARVLGIQYDAADQAVDLVHDGNNAHVGFRYGPNRERVSRLDYANAFAPTADTIVHYVGGAEIRYAVNANGAAGTLQNMRRYAGNVILVQSGGGGSYRLKRQVLLTDRQGSTYQVLGAMTMREVNAASPMSFDAWGKRREAERWSEAAPWAANLEGLLRTSSTHGYTGHEMAEAVGVIHMNGRLYDPHFGRFLQADPLVQSPQNLQSWNRYSYAFNNPLAYTDPSGHMSVGDWARTLAAVAITVYSGGTAAGASWGLFGEAVTAGQAWGAVLVGGFSAGAVQTGSLRGAVSGAVTSAVFFSIGNAFSYKNAPGLYGADHTTLTFSGYAAKTLSHGIAGGVMAELQGGRFGHGFAAAGLSEALSPAPSAGDGAGAIAAKTITAAVVGGTASRIAGGKFVNGAVTAAFGFAFNHVVHNGFRGRGSYDADGEEAISALKSRAEEITDRAAGQDGVVDISNAELSEVFKYEGARLELRSKVRGGYQNLSDAEFLTEARDYGDSLFFGDVKYGGNGGRLYRIGGRGPYLGGNINYINQGQIFAIGNRSIDQAIMAVTAWNLSGAGSLQYLDQRLDFTGIGYQMWKDGR